MRVKAVVKGQLLFLLTVFVKYPDHHLCFSRNWFCDPSYLSMEIREAAGIIRRYSGMWYIDRMCLSILRGRVLVVFRKTKSG